MIDVEQVLTTAGGFVRTLGPTVVSTGRDALVLRLDAGPELHNHLSGPHAAALFGLGETAAFGLLLAVFGDLVEAGVVPLVKGSTIAYSAVATGPVTATARLTGQEQAARASVEQRGVAVFGVEVVLHRESDGRETARATYDMALKRM